MDGTVKPSLRSPEEAAFARYYDDLLRISLRPVQLAELLYSDGIIRSETNKKVTSEEDEDHAKRILLDAVQCALAQSSDQEEVMSSFCSALEKIQVSNQEESNIYEILYSEVIRNFIAGEYNCVKATVI